MGAIVNFSLDVTKLPKDKMIKGKKGTYINITAFLGDVDQFGNNASIIVSQTQEEREAKAQRTYLGNGKVAWTDGVISAAETGSRSGSTSSSEATEDETDGLPF